MFKLQPSGFSLLTSSGLNERHTGGVSHTLSVGLPACLPALTLLTSAARAVTLTRLSGSIFSLFQPTLDLVSVVPF